MLIIIEEMAVSKILSMDSRKKITRYFVPFPDVGLEFTQIHLNIPLEILRDPLGSKKGRACPLTENPCCRLSSRKSNKSHNEQSLHLLIGCKMNTTIETLRGRAGSPFRI